MDELIERDAFCQSIQLSNPNHSSSADFGHQTLPNMPLPNMPLPSNQLPHVSSNQRPETELKDSITARKVQKADREKLRRDRLNEQFMELGNTLDPERPKNDKASILSDTIQWLKDLTAQVSRLKADHAALTEESRELTQEKNDLKEEKASLKSDIENLNAQYQQRLRSVYPWSGVDHPVVMHPSYHFSLPMPIAPGPIPMHPPLQPYPFFGNQNPAVVPNPCSTFVPYVNPTTVIEQQSIQFATPGMGTGSRSCTSSKQDSRNKSSGQEESRVEKSEDSKDVATNLELKTPGSTPDQDSSSKHGKSSKLLRKENSPTDGGSSSRCSSSHSVQASSSNCINGGTNFEDR
uniref:Transcription factor bHLH40 n=1 Tax=Nothapodytes nimmoniana TaxID=159386 RepID=A0A9E9BYY3_NOTNI|nr:transcription factor bHLH40 [Nothapodytes nimmoniana]